MSSRDLTIGESETGVYQVKGEVLVISGERRAQLSRRRQQRRTRPEGGGRDGSTREENDLRHGRPVSFPKPTNSAYSEILELLKKSEEGVEFFFLVVRELGAEGAETFFLGVDPEAHATIRSYVELRMFEALRGALRWKVQSKPR